jgi:hypothetical protein
MTPQEKKKLLSELVWLMVYTGYDISSLMGKPLNFFDYDKVKEHIKHFQSIYDNQ